jgi:excisionase family DNA binding protein
MSTPSERLNQALDVLHRSLEEFESALLEFEEALEGEETRRPQHSGGLDLLSIVEVCQELGMGKSWVYKKIKSGEIPSVKLGRNIKVRHQDLQEYFEKQRRQPSVER